MDKLNQWLQLLAAVSVLIGLIFVGVELGQNARATEAQTKSQISIAYSNFMDSVRNDEATLNAFKKRGAKETLDYYDELRLALIYSSLLKLAENAFYQHRQGFYASEEFAGELNQLRAVIASAPHFKKWWMLRQNDFSPAFRTEFEVLVDATSNGQEPFFKD
ncbi:MAG: hypothetical protein AAF512_01055 [Pseudomonadota bacterium]